MTPQDDEALTRHLTAIRAKHFQWIAKQDPTLTWLKQVLEEERAIQQMDSRTLLAFCTDLEARFARGVEENPR
jgi:hypothetical protein